VIKGAFVSGIGIIREREVWEAGGVKWVSEFAHRGVE